MMKIFIKIFVTIVVVVFGVVNTNAQKEMKEGRIEYRGLNVDSLNPNMPPMYRYYYETLDFKNNKLKTTNYFTARVPQVHIYDDLEHTEIYLGGGMASPLATITFGEALNMRKAREKFYYYNYTGESKVIYDYKCYKADYSIEGDSNKYYVYFTPEITFGNYYIINRNFPGLIGFPMEFNCFSGTVEAIVSIGTISEEDIDDNIFIIPEHYKIEYRVKKQE